MPDKLDPKTDPARPLIYQIRIRGHLPGQWSDWFAGLAITLEDNGDTLLTGPLADQAALFGLLKEVRDLGIPLVSVSPMESSPKVTSGNKKTRTRDSRKVDQ